MKKFSEFFVEGKRDNSKFSGAYAKKISKELRYNFTSYSLDEEKEWDVIRFKNNDIELSLYMDFMEKVLSLMKVKNLKTNTSKIFDLKGLSQDSDFDIAIAAKKIQDNADKFIGRK